ncbi:hypothetical protein GCM10010172_61350 [Paractinoplanes ferrugineus]|uniref:Uncharacterized protein n=1 Tax=Paractinoplanes ferrugineus TaxID=113564 RepID=A0A919MNR1_9ACTN|nr:hypothetical protein Afe05nite_63770 [Actinoplanes ferrugineus]
MAPALTRDCGDSPKAGTKARNPDESGLSDAPAVVATTVVPTNSADAAAQTATQGFRI